MPPTDPVWPAETWPDQMRPDRLRIFRSRAAGLDVHKAQITATVRLCAPDGSAPRAATREFSSLARGLGEMTAWLRSHDVQCATMEGTGIYWLQPYEALEDADIPVELVHAQQVRQIKGRKTDVSDSIWLARVCQYGLATPSLIPPRDFRALRFLSRYRRKLIAERGRVRNRIHKLIDRCGVRVGVALTDIFGRNGRRILDGLVNGEDPQQILDSLTVHVRSKLATVADILEARLDPQSLWLLNDMLAAADAVSRRIQHAGDLLEAGLAPYERSLRLLETLPGVGRESACEILVETGPDIDVFPSSSRFAAWAGLCPGNSESGGKRASGRARKGNAALRAVLTECALGAARTQHCQFRGFHKALTVRRGYKRATLATAHKMLRCIYAVLRDNKPYQDPETDYEQLLVARNAPRWIQQLQKYGFLKELNLPSARPA